MVEEVYEALTEALDKVIKGLGREYSKVRTGRANAAILEGVKAEYYGTPTSINQMATISVPEARLIVISPWDASALGEIEKALQKSDLGLNPMNDGKVLRISFPQLTEERRKDLVKKVKKIGEDFKVTVRKERREAIDMLKEMEKEKQVSEDECRKAQDKVQKHHDDYIGKIDEIINKKETEIMEV